MNIQQIENQRLIPLYAKRDIALVRGEGIFLFDENGKRYFDLMSNYGVNVLGYGNKAYEEALKNQIDKLTNVHSSFYSNSRAYFLEKLHSILPNELSCSFISSTGAESVEAAIKFARSATGRTNIISAKRGYHGRTMGALSATAVPKYQKPFAPLLPGFIHVQYNDIQVLKEALDENVAAVILEPIQGEGGVNIPDDDYLFQVKELCAQNGSLLILDEIQTGLRTGRWLASEHFGIVPDILCLSKGLGNGLPIAVTCISEEIVAKVPKGAHGTTFGGNALACRAALATLQEIDQNNLLKNSEEVGSYLIEQLRSLDSSLVREVRGKGLMIAVELKQKAGFYAKQLQEEGVLVMVSSNLLRLLPPLVITKEDVDLVVEKFRVVLS